MPEDGKNLMPSLRARRGASPRVEQKLAMMRKALAYKTCSIRKDFLFRIKQMY